MIRELAALVELGIGVLVEVRDRARLRAEREIERVGRAAWRRAARLLGYRCAAQWHEAECAGDGADCIPTGRAR